MASLFRDILLRLRPGTLLCITGIGVEPDWRQSVYFKEMQLSTLERRFTRPVRRLEQREGYAATSRLASCHAIPIGSVFIVQSKLIHVSDPSYMQ